MRRGVSHCAAPGKEEGVRGRGSATKIHAVDISRAIILAALRHQHLRCRRQFLGPALCNTNSDAILASAWRRNLISFLILLLALGARRPAAHESTIPSGENHHKIRVMEHKGVCVDSLLRVPVADATRLPEVGIERDLDTRIVRQMRTDRSRTRWALW